MFEVEISWQVIGATWSSSTVYFIRICAKAMIEISYSDTNTRLYTHTHGLSDNEKEQLEPAGCLCEVCIYRPLSILRALSVIILLQLFLIVLKFRMWRSVCIIYEHYIITVVYQELGSHGGLSSWDRWFLVYEKVNLSMRLFFRLDQSRWVCDAYVVKHCSTVL